MCGDRNLYSKQLIEAKDEITEMKRKLKILSHQIDQLKEEIASKVRSIIIVNNIKLHVHVLYPLNSVCITATHTQLCYLFFTNRTLP